MALSAAEFLEIVERDHQVPSSVVGMLRQQIATAPRPVAAATLAKYLVDKKHLQPAVVRQILSIAEPQPRQGADLNEALKETAEPRPSNSTAEQVRSHMIPPGQRPKSEPASPVQAKTKPQPPPEEEELGLAPDDDDDLPHAKPAPSTKPASPVKPVGGVAQPVASRTRAAATPVPRSQPLTEDDLGLAPDDTESPKPKPSIATGKSTVKAAAVTTVAPGTSPPAAGKTGNPPQAKSPMGAKPAGSAPAGAKKPAGVKANRPVPAATNYLDEISEPLVEITDGGDDLFADVSGLAGLESLTGEASLATAAPLESTVKRRPDRRLSPMQRGLIVGGATFAVLLTLAAILVVNSLRSNGEPEFALAEKDYEARANQAAVEKFMEFLDSFARHPRTAWRGCI